MCRTIKRVTHNPESKRLPEPEELAGKELERLRNERGWSQEYVARSMGARGFTWHQTTVGRTERAQRPLRLNEAVALAALFGVPLHSLLSPTAMRAAEIDQEIARSETEQKMFEERYVAAGKELEKLEGPHIAAKLKVARLEQELERIRSHLETLRLLRDQVAAPGVAVRLGRDDSGEVAT